MTILNKHYLRRFIVIAFSSAICLTHTVSAQTPPLPRTAATLPAAHLQALNTEILNSKELLRKNKVAAPAAVDDVIQKIDILWQELQLIGSTERTGLDTEWRAPFVIIQSAVERALTSLLQNHQIEKAHCILVAPRMSTPLLESSTLTLDQVQLSLPRDFSKLRKATMEEFFKLRGILHTVYPHDATTTITPEQLADYQKNLEAFPGMIQENLLDSISSLNFPHEITGALYIIDNDISKAITFQTYQTSQLKISTSQPLHWAIKINSAAKERIEEIRQFFRQQNVNLLP